MMKALSLLAAFSLTLLAHTDSASANNLNVLWSTTGTGCLQAPEDIGEFATDGIGLKHASGGTGAITLVCPITQHDNHSGVPHNRLTVTVKDADQTGSNQIITYYLKRASKTTAAGSTIISASTGSGSTGIHTLTTANPGFSHTFDFENYYYYVYVIISRNASATDYPVFYGAMIHYVP